MTDIRTARQLQGRLLREVAAAAHIDAAALSRIERGHRIPRVDTLRRIARALNLEVVEYSLAGILPPHENGNGRPKE